MSAPKRGRLRFIVMILAIGVVAAHYKLEPHYGGIIAQAIAAVY